MRVTDHCDVLIGDARRRIQQGLEPPCGPCDGEWFAAGSLHVDRMACLMCRRDCVVETFRRKSSQVPPAPRPNERLHAYIAGFDRLWPRLAPAAAASQTQRKRGNIARRRRLSGRRRLPVGGGARPRPGTESLRGPFDETYLGQLSARSAYSRAVRI